MSAAQNHPYEREHHVALEAVRLAARLCQDVASRITPDVLEKKDRSPVTVADFGSQAIICRALHEAFADDPIIAEEDSEALRDPGNAGLRDRVVEHVNAVHNGADAEQVCQWIDYGGAKQYADRFWTLDPIDGTKGFLRKEQYAISLALIVEGRIEVAVLGCPNLPLDPTTDQPCGAVFTAVHGQGAFVRPIDDTDAAPQPIRVSGKDSFKQARFCESVESGHSSHSDAQAIARQLNIMHPPVRMDSQAKYAAVARGEAEIYLRLPTRADYVEKIWDHAGGVLIVTEAGGTVTDVNGKPLQFTHGATLQENRGVIVTNGVFHDRVLAAVSVVGVK
jgi:3'(2'), 5'-bisphosphate nucleotidase